MPPTYAALTDNVGIPGDWLVQEPIEKYGRKNIVLDGIATAQDIKSGTVLGRVRGAATPAAVAGNTGNGVLGAVTLSAGAKEGVYTLSIIAAAANAGTFTLEDPDGLTVDTGTVAVAFSSGGLAFTLADGATDFVVGDEFTITVAAGTKHVVHDQDGTDGSEIAVGILMFDTLVAVNVDKKAVMLDRDAQVRQGGLIWQSDITAGEIAVAVAQLEALGIRMRQGDV